MITWSFQFLLYIVSFPVEGSKSTCRLTSTDKQLSTATVCHTHRKDFMLLSISLLYISHESSKRTYQPSNSLDDLLFTVRTVCVCRDVELINWNTLLFLRLFITLGQGFQLERQRLADYHNKLWTVTKTRLNANEVSRGGWGEYSRLNNRKEQQSSYSEVYSNHQEATTPTFRLGYKEEAAFPKSSFMKGFKKNIIPGFQIGPVAFP